VGKKMAGQKDGEHFLPNHLLASELLLNTWPSNFLPQRIHDGPNVIDQQRNLQRTGTQQQRVPSSNTRLLRWLREHGAVPRSSNRLTFRQLFRW
jgi:hypothetical protein